MSEEKIKLARMGLGLKEVVFKSDMDAEHIHRTILDALEYGDYSLLRLAENLHTMVVIKGLQVTVAYPKDILYHVKLYIRLLQNNTDEDMKYFLSKR